VPENSRKEGNRRIGRNDCILAGTSSYPMVKKRGKPAAFPPLFEAKEKEKQAV
jgi:hypothetical protein